jgi:hypothetical protein
MNPLIKIRHSKIGGGLNKTLFVAVRLARGLVLHENRPFSDISLTFSQASSLLHRYIDVQIHKKLKQKKRRAESVIGHSIENSKKNVQQEGRGVHDRV